jgi:hypothetical protein
MIDKKVVAGATCGMLLWDLIGFALCIGSWLSAMGVGLMLEITLPWPDTKKLSPNARVHWAVKHKAAIGGIRR